MKESKLSIAYLTTFPPRECGIATFCRDLTVALDKAYPDVLDAKIIALNTSSSEGLNYPKKVIFQISQDKPEDYKQAARLVNKSAAIPLAVIQHEFGIFGGAYGSFLLDFLNELKKPSVIIFHTILPAPNPDRLAMVGALAAKTSQIVVMTELSKQILEQDYNIPPEKITIIPHGIHPVAYESSQKAKSKLRLPSTTIISTFGLLGRGKGVEYLLDALPAVIKKYPKLLYLVIGKTHPAVLREEGENYRKFLEQKVRELQLANNVRFINQYLNLQELLRYLQATDIYIASSLDPNHTVSGTFSYAAGAGRPIIATPFAHAKAELKADMGTLVAFKNPDSFSHALIDLLDHPENMEQMGKNNYFRTRRLIWPNIAIAYAKLYARFVPALNENHIHLPPIKLDHLARLTDDFGIFQFAVLETPDPGFGYTLDDNSRALMVAAMHYSSSRLPLALKLAKVYLKFVENSFSPDGKFLNYFNRERRPEAVANQRDNLEESNARGLRALMAVSSLKALPKPLREKAKGLYEKRLAAGVDFSSPRAMAVYIEALCFQIKNNPEPTAQEQINLYCDKLLQLLKENSTGGWQWFEKYLTYSNSTLSKALLLGYTATGKREYFQAGKDSLDFLIRQTFLNGVYVPIGQKGWFTESGERAFFDQQPEDTATMVQTLKLMYDVSGKEIYEKLAHVAFNWFLGGNVLGQFVYDASSGGCYDGLGEKNINLNQGAESTILYLLARLSVEAEK